MKLRQKAEFLVLDTIVSLWRLIWVFVLTIARNTLPLGIKRRLDRKGTYLVL